MTRGLEITTIGTELDIRQVLALQRANLPDKISPEAAIAHGFVTVQHDEHLLGEMNRAIPQVIARDEERVVGYALAMLPSFRYKIPVLRPMFDVFGQIAYNQRLVADYQYYVMGQICIAETHRGTGIFERLYHKHKALFASQFDFCITEIAHRNTRSLRAHERMGFKTIHNYRDDKEEWAIVLWDWA